MIIVKIAVSFHGLYRKIPPHALKAAHNKSPIVLMRLIYVLCISKATMLTINCELHYSMLLHQH